MNGLLFQLQTFFLTGLIGVTAGFIFHYYQLTIRKARIGKYFLYIMDLIWWILILLVVFAAMLLINQGEIRFYIILTLLAGVIVYFYYFSARLTKVVEQGAQGTIYIIAYFSTIARILPDWLKKIIAARKTSSRPPPAE